MKAIAKNRLTSQQRGALNKAVKEQFLKVKDRSDKKMQEQVLLLFTIAACVVLEEQYNYGEKRRHDFIQALYSKADEISKSLLDNKCIEQGREQYDTEWNREILQRYATRYNLKYDESIFDEIDYDEE